VQIYSLWNSTDAAAWNQHPSGRHEAWGYHCISPRPQISHTGVPGDMKWLNTFLESPPLEPRLLGWWAAGEPALNGWLCVFIPQRLFFYIFEFLLEMALRLNGTKRPFSDLRV
jgi:hypothetical protein